MMRWVGLLVVFTVAGCASSRGGSEGEREMSLIAETPSSSITRSAGSLWKQDPESLFGNRRAREAGDILTVIVEIDEEAELENEVDQSRASSENFSLRNLFGVEDLAANTLPGAATLDPGVDYDRTRSFQGTGTVRRQSRIVLRLAARVTRTLPNGDLVIDGQQQVRVNDEVRTLRASGVVRPEDISRSNTIPHDRIAEASIGYVGRGAANRAGKPGIGNRLLDIIIPF